MRVDFGVLFIVVLLVSFIVSNQVVEISRTYSHYQSKTFLSNRAFERTPKNFDEYISIFSDCIAHIINFEGLDIIRTSQSSQYIPLVLSRYDFVRVGYNDSKSFNYELPFEKIKATKNLADISASIALTKPTTILRKLRGHCGVHIYLHPPKTTSRFYYKWLRRGILFVNKMTYLSLEFWKPVRESLQDYHQLYMQAQVNARWHYDILISKSTLPDDVTIAWVTGLLQDFYWYHQAPRQSWEMIHWKVNKRSNQIKAVQLFCRYCHNCFPYYPVFISSEYLMSIKSFQTRMDVMNSQTDHIVWKLKFYDMSDNIGYLKPPDEKDTLENFGKRFLNPYTDQRRQAIDQLMFSYVLGNATYHELEYAPKNDWQSEYCLSNQNKDCGCEKEYKDSIDLILYPHITFYEDATWYPMHLQFDQVNLLFAACGHSRGKPAFYALVSPYDKYSWLSILICLVMVVPLVLVTMETFYCYVKSMANASFLTLLKLYVFASFRSLFEQGYIKKPYSYVRWVSSAMLLTAVILSNAYKGKNITKIISPLPPIPFTVFNNLVNNDFKIYSWASEDFHFEMEREAVWNEYRKCNECYSKVGTHCFSSAYHKIDGHREDNFKIRSCLLMSLDYSTRRYFQMVVPDTINLVRYCDIELTFTDRELFILNNSMLIPPTWKYFNVSFNPIQLLENCGVDSRFSIVDEESILLSFKISYNNASTSSRFKGPVSFGTEVLGSYAKGYVLKGSIPERIWIRMQGLYSSGILVWQNLFWKKFYKDTGMLQDVPSIRGFQASSLSGSIKVVFIVFPAGFLTAFLCILIENYKKVEAVGVMSLGGLSKVWNICLSKIKKFKFLVQPTKYQMNTMKILKITIRADKIN